MLTKLAITLLKDFSDSHRIGYGLPDRSLTSALVVGFILRWGEWIALLDATPQHSDDIVNTLFLSLVQNLRQVC